MRGLLLIIFLLSVVRANAQIVSGKVIDKDTHMPMAYIVITSNSSTTFTDDMGIFMLKISDNLDTIRINAMAYKPFKLPVSRWGKFMRVIEMDVKYTQLGEVVITAKKNYHQDSVSLREEYAKQFNFRGPKFSEIVRMPSAAMPFAGITIDVGSLFRAINKKHSRDYKLQQVLLRDEREHHVSVRFTKALVSSITTLHGDSLENFMRVCRPSAAELDKLNDYDLIQYIKIKLLKFSLNSTKKDDLPKMLKDGESLE